MFFQAAAIVEATANLLIFTSERARIAPAEAGVQFRAAAAQVAELLVAATVAIAAGVAAAAAGAVASAAWGGIAATFAAAGGSRRRRRRRRSGSRGRRRRRSLRGRCRDLRVVVVVAVLVRRRRKGALFCFCVGRGGKRAAGHGDKNRPFRAVHVLDSNPLKGLGGRRGSVTPIPLGRSAYRQDGRRESRLVARLRCHD